MFLDKNGFEECKAVILVQKMVQNGNRIHFENWLRVQQSDVKGEKADEKHGGPAPYAAGRTVLSVQIIMSN